MDDRWGLSHSCVEDDIDELGRRRDRRDVLQSSDRRHGGGLMSGCRLSDKRCLYKIQAFDDDIFPKAIYM